MQQGGSRANGRIHEIEDYLADRIDDVENEASAAVTTANNDDKDREEVRRLNALVTHLREQVGEIQSRPASEARGHRGRSGFPMFSITGLLAVGLIGVLWSLQTRNFHRY